MDLRLQLANAATQVGPHLLQICAIHSDAGMLHPGQDRDQWKFEFGKEGRLVTIRQLGLQLLDQASHRLHPPPFQLYVGPGVEWEHPGVVHVIRRDELQT